MMKRLCAFFTLFILIFSFSACSDKSETDSVKPADLEVTFLLNKSKSIAGRVCFDTNLPTGTKLDVEIFIGSKFYSSETVSVQSDIYSNYFITEPQAYQDGKIIEDGKYIFRANLSSIDSQPEEVKSVIGSKGEKLSGTFVYEKDGVKTVKISKPLLKQNDKFTIPE